MIFLYLLASYGLAFCLKEKSGPFGIFSRIRNFLFTNRFIGVFFFELFQCYLCLGFYSGSIIYLIVNKHILINELIVWSFASASSTYIINLFIEKYLS